MDDTINQKDIISILIDTARGYFDEPDIADSEMFLEYAEAVATKLLSTLDISNKESV